MTALILVDIQNDFLPGGALPVKEGDQIIPLANKLLNHQFDLKIATKDWHPTDHGSFAVNHGKKPGDIIPLAGIPQILWPVHCVQKTAGAEFPDNLEIEKIHHIIYKGTDKMIDSYSTFFDNDLKKSTGLDKFLSSKNIHSVYIAGLATDYCVLFSVLDALKLGFKTYVIADACRGIDLCRGDVERSFETMKDAGAILTTSNDILKEFRHR